MSSAAFLRELLQLDEPSLPDYSRRPLGDVGDHTREAVTYNGKEGDTIPALLFLPRDGVPKGGVVAFHQHAGEFHFGKSEVAGDVGDPHQAFGPALARNGLAVLAPDAVAFEDRRANASGVVAHDDDWLQHYNAMAYRLVDGDTLMRKVLDDAQRALSVLRSVVPVEGAPIGVVGHSYGGLVSLYHAAVDGRCAFCCVSGALCSHGTRRAHGTGYNVFEVVPGIAQNVTPSGLLRMISPRPMLVVSATEDPYARDADKVVAESGAVNVAEVRTEGPHALDQFRFNAIVDWVTAQAAGLRGR